MLGEQDLIIGCSQQIKLILAKVEKIANTPYNVLITGETGTGKELVARTIHNKSKRNKNPFVAINCAAIPESLFESELFGIEKGIATGVERRIGKIGAAQNGHVFLDEIGEMPIHFQSKVLRVTEGKSFELLGSLIKCPMNARIISATNKELKKEIEAGRFREDLFYRLNVIPIHIPSLRERKDDILVLAHHFLNKAKEILSKNINGISPQAIKILVEYTWPGNVRELKNAVERAAIFSDNCEITASDLEQSIDFECTHTALSKLQGAEASMIMNALKETGGNKTETAKYLGMCRETLRMKMKLYGIIVPFNFSHIQSEDVDIKDHQ